jgi:hypothetical protein
MFGQTTNATKKIYSERRFRKISESTKLQYLGKAAYVNLKDSTHQYFNVKEL